MADKVGRDKIREYLKDCKTVLDLGCGPKKIRKDSLGVDCNLEVKPDVLSYIEQVTIVEDGVCMSHSLEHIIDIRDLLLTIYFGLSNSGRIAIITPDGEAVQSGTLGTADNDHEQLFTAITLKLYLENAGFKNVVSEYYERPTAYNKVRGIFAGGEK